MPTDFSSRPGWRITRTGVYWLAITAVLLLVGIVRNINLLSLLGCLLFALFLVQALAVGRGLSKLQARRWASDVIHTGVGCPVEVRIHNPTAGTVKGLWIENSGPGHLAGWHIGTLEPGGRRTCRCEVVSPGRGWYELEPVRAASGHPFGLVRVAVELSEPMRLLVLPRPGRIARDRLRRYLHGGEPHGERIRHRGRPHPLARADFHGLRPYRPGDSPRWVHWRTSARRGELMVREFEDVPGEDLLLILDPSGPDGENFERAVTLAASLAWEWCQRLGDRLMFAIANGSDVMDGRTGPEHGRRVLEALALATGGPATLPDLSVIMPRTAGVVVVSAGESALPGQMESALGRHAAHLDASQAEELPFFTPPAGG